MNLWSDYSVNSSTDDEKGQKGKGKGVKRKI